jgi:hypothetical protein
MVPCRGRLLMFMSSLNWILRPQVKLMFELGAGRVSGTAADGNLLLAQLRMGVYCYLSVLATVGASSHP